MGGFGSGRQDGMPYTDEMRRLDIRALHRSGALTAGRSSGWEWNRHGGVVASVQITAQTDRIWVEYRQRLSNGEWHVARYAVLLDRTACHMGGERVLWQCPQADCGRRCAILYGSKIFACRQCHQLAYRSQRETVGDRATRRANKLRQRMGGRPASSISQRASQRGCTGARSTCYSSTIILKQTRHLQFKMLSYLGSARSLYQIRR